MVLKVSGLPQPHKPATERLYTVAEWLSLPERPHLELVEGRLHEMPNSTPNHDLIIFNLRMALSLYVMANQLGRVLGEVNVIIEKLAQPNGWIPDTLFIANHNSAKISSNVTGVPDWVLEVWAGDEKRSGRISEKRQRWEQAGVPELWEVIWRKDQQIVKIYQLREGHYQEVPTDGQTQLCSQVIEGFCIERDAIFANLVQEG